MDKSSALPVLPGVMSLSSLEKMIDSAALSVGILSGAGEGRPTNALTVWRTLKELYFSVPVDPQQQTWDDAKKESIFAEWMQKETGVSRTVWLAEMRRKLKATARQRAREKELKRRK